MATRRSCRLLSKKDITPASGPKSSNEDMDIDSDEKYVSSCSSSDDEYKPPKKQDSTDEFEDDVPAKKSKHKDIQPTHVSESSADEPFELECLEVDLSEGGTSSDECDNNDVRANIKKSIKKVTGPKKQSMQKIKIPKLSQIKRANNVTLDDHISNKNISERRLQLESLPGCSKVPLCELKKYNLADSANQGTAALSTQVDKVTMKERVGDGKSSESLKDVINAMLLENEPQASCSYILNDAPKSGQHKSKKTAKNSLVSSAKQSAAPRGERSPVKTRSSQFQGVKMAKSVASSVKSGKKAGKTSNTTETEAKAAAKKLPEKKKQLMRGKKTGPQRAKFENNESSSESDWEEVPEGADLDSYAPVVPESGITITLKEPVMTGKRKKAKFDPVAEMRRRINRVRKEIHVLKHKVHLLCLLAHGLKLNSLILDQTLQAVALSLLPSEFLAYSGKTVTLLDVERMSRLFTKVFVCKLGTPTGFHALHDDLTMALTTKIAQNARDYALLFLVIVRCLQIEARFCMSLYPVPLDAVQLLKTDTKPGRKSAELKVPSKKKAQKMHSEPDEVDSDFEVEKPKKVTGKKKVNDASSNKKSGKKGKTGEENAEKCEQSISDCIEHWIEIFTPKDSKWIAVDVVHGSVGSITERNIREPLYYILSFDDNNKVKDITKKYASGWLTSVKKKRIDPKWWEESLKPFRPTDSERERVENTQIQSKLQRQPMPGSIAEFKNHPLYALKRHLLKFEAIYPSDAPTLGFVRGEPVYARECVHTLRSRETWLREARMVRVKEQPYKVVKARPKYDKLSGQILKEQPLELFGHWQTEPYMPPIAFNGKVPRNEWGNVELFKSCMLPVGTVHLRAPGLARVAAKLNIDCVPAVVGFEGHCRGVHPVFDGWVVCEEFKDTLMAAWEEEQANISNREEEKRMKRVYGNWKRLIKGVLIKEKLRMKYMNDD
ncbi:hypothetical protein HPB49_000407 [Dermacentor silvarum]|uniref:Uncharacterized protein n=1 Tax=Dermacentor silvarum TaxID=543639 RepID=A0ACB8CTZ9_DERSI|nr:DNA repair protein complementing XP-C cells isoform X1 [Dermacentor silvarum]KAH7952679.1 hypothetical protein HPB49_000407 [Dermacentor silvarum]